MNNSLTNFASELGTKPNTVKRPVSDYIKAVLLGQPATPPKSKFDTLIALYAAKAAIGCCIGRASDQSKRICAEIKRVANDHPTTEPGHEAHSESQSSPAA